MKPDDGVAMAGWFPPGRPEVDVEGPDVEHPAWRLARFDAIRRAMAANTPPERHWYLNMLAEPAVTVKLGGDERAGRARDVDDPDERHRCGGLMGAKYVWDGDPDIGLTYHAWCYDVPAIAIEFPGEDLSAPQTGPGGWC